MPTTHLELLGSLAQRSRLLPIGASCRDVDRCFLADRARTSAVVETDHLPLLVNRRQFYETLTGPLGYGRTLHYDRPVAEVIPSDGEALTHDVTAEEAALLLLSRARAASGDILVGLPEGWGTVGVAELYRHLAERHRERAAALARSEARFRLLVEHAVDVITILDADGRVTYRSRDIAGFAAVPVGGDAFANVHPEDVADLQVAMQQGLRHPGGLLRGEFRMLGLDGGTRLFEYSARNCLDDPSICGIVVNHRDVTERRALEAQLLHHAHHDPLTGLPNRSLLLQRAEYALARLERVTGQVAVIYLDLDGFKYFNDELGHDFGDELIVAVAHRLRALVRRGDTLARLGGDEFVVLTDGCAGQEPEELCRRLHEALEEPFVVRGQPARVTGSFGLALTDAPMEVAALLQQADSAMYAAKGAGRNRVERFDPVHHERRLRLTRLGVDLRAALDRGELRLDYQLIVEAATGLPRGVEALARWDHPVFGAVPPIEFVALAEQQGLIGQLGAWVLDEACSQLTRWTSTGVAPAYVSVNVSAHQLDDPDLPATVLRTLGRTGVPPDRLQLEVTESGLATESPGRVAVLDALRAAGIAVAIDDFGTGYSSLSYLSHLPVDVVKLDGSFAADLDGSHDAFVLVRSVVELAHSLGHRVTAEGVETDAQRRQLRDLGCDDLQGYLVARPTSPSVTAASLRDLRGSRRSTVPG